LNVDRFISFKRSVKGIRFPERLPNPFYFKVHPLAMIASEELQEYIERQENWSYYCGLQSHDTIVGIGKMFGVLVVENDNKELGYLAAYSGKLAYTNNHPHFVPPIFDMLEIDKPQDTFYQVGEQKLYAMSEEIARMEQDETLHKSKGLLYILETKHAITLKTLQQQRFLSKQQRQKMRDSIKDCLPDERNLVLEMLKQESIREHFELKDFKKKYRLEREELITKIEIFQREIDNLKETRKRFSKELQDHLFAQYHFLNALGERKNVLELFKDHFDEKPPAGAGECCAPKLLHYAYQHKLKPIAMAEFWWGKSPNSEIRHHKQFYPACKGKCFPILSHMLKGIDVDKNPIEEENIKIPLKIIYEDEFLLAIDKPSELLSVPGKTRTLSVFDLLCDYLPKEQKPWMVHRLDMSTSGILIVAKNKDVYVHLQEQFSRKTIKKRYIALLESLIIEQKGTISLPLRVDLDDRPRQLVCFKHGKLALTQWEKIEQKEGKTRVYFYPITGRTHQLRIHAAHHLGLNAPIVGDNLYGTHADRLYLHADRLQFVHPKTKKKITLHSQVPF